jgi:hypothetical protein
MENITFEDPSKWVSRPKNSSHRALLPEESVAQHRVTQTQGKEPLLQNGERNKPNPDAISAIGSLGTL